MDSNVLPSLKENWKKKPTIYNYFLIAKHICY